MTSPLVPADYEEAKAAGWTYHRNGICGCGFWAKVEDDALHIAWSVPDDDNEDERYPVAASIPLSVLTGFAQLPSVGRLHEDTSVHYAQLYRHVVDVADGTPQIYVIDFHEYEVFPHRTQLKGRVLVVADPTEDDPDRYAAFVLQEILDGDASTTLRGDNFYSYATQAAALVGAA